MNKKRKVTLVVTGMVLILLAVTCVSASPWRSSTPLYRFRMEQASSKMNFLPTGMNAFTYTTQEGYDLNYNAAGCCIGAEIMITGVTCYDSCGGTCEYTCWDTCVSTCPNTCVSTCSTCSPTCWNTCEHTCRYTCTKPCIP